MDLNDSGDELMPTECLHSSHSFETAGQDISPASHVPLPCRSRELRADTGAKVSHVAARKNSLSKHAAPHLRAAFCRVQSTITWLLTHSHDTSPTSAAAVCRGYPLIHMIPAPHQWLPCVEDSALSLVQGDMGPLRCKKSPHPPAQKSVQRRGVFDAPAREGEE